MSLKDSLSERIKEYENVSQFRLMKKQPVIIRVDGRSFKKFTKGLDKPFDKDLNAIFEYVCYKLREKVDNVKFVYSQSDEISLLLTDWDRTKEDNGTRIDTWYDYRIQKMVSVISSETTRLFNKKVDEIAQGYYELSKKEDIDDNTKKYYETKYNLWNNKKYNAVFDARAFNLPVEEVTNYFIQRQSDAIRNSQLGFSRSFYSQKELLNVSNAEALERVRIEYKQDYDDVSNVQKMGFCIVANELDGKAYKVDKRIPLFKNNREYIEKYL